MRLAVTPHWATRVFMSVPHKMTETPVFKVKYSKLKGDEYFSQQATTVEYDKVWTYPSRNDFRKISFSSLAVSNHIPRNTNMYHTLECVTYCADLNLPFYGKNVTKKCFYEFFHECFYESMICLFLYVHQKFYILTSLTWNWSIWKA